MRGRGEVRGEREARGECEKMGRCGGVRDQAGDRRAVTVERLR